MALVVQGAPVLASAPGVDPATSPERIPFLPAPQGQVQTRPRPQEPLLATQASQQRRFALTLAPVVGGLRIPLSGRTGRPVGFGYDLQAEVALRSWLWLSAGWQRLHYLVYAESQPTPNSVEVTPLASKGWLRWQDLSLGVRYALDDGAVRPIFEAGAAWTSMTQPDGVQDGQSAQACVDQQGCDPGLRCVDNACVPAPFPSAYVGAEAQWLIARHFSLGVAARYFISMLAGNKMQFPSQWTLALRASVRY